MAENFQREKKALFAALADRVRQAENAEAAAKQDVEKRYERHLKQADEKAEALYNDGLVRREKCYQELLQIAKTSSDVAELTKTAKEFEKLDGYQDSRNLAEHCRKRAAEDQAKLDAVNEQQRLFEEKQKQAKKAKRKKLSIFAAVATAIVIAVIMVVTTVVIPGNNYKKAEALRSEGKYLEAMEVYYKSPGHKGCEENIKKFEDQILSQIGGMWWESEEHFYDYYYYYTSYLGDYKCFHQVAMYFDETDKKCFAKETYLYYDLVTGRRKHSKDGDYEDRYNYSIQVSDGAVYLTNIEGFVGGKVELVCEVSGDQIILLSIKAMVDMYEDDYTATFNPLTD